MNCDSRMLVSQQFDFYIYHEMLILVSCHQNTKLCL